MPLNDRQINALKAKLEPYKVADGGGLSIRVTPNGSKLWRFAYRLDGKQKEMAFGAYPEVSLAAARDKRTKAKAQLTEGIDPARAAKVASIQRRIDAGSTFAQIADELIEKNTKEERAEATLRKKRWFLSLLARDLGNLPIKEIRAAEALAPLRKIEAAGNYETAKKVRAFISQVFRYAIATSRAEIDPTYGLRGALISPKVQHRPAIIERDRFLALVKTIWHFENVTPTTLNAIKLLALLYTRPSELRLAAWQEFDFDNRTWTIPAPRTKMRREHKKPLSTHAIDILLAQRDISGNLGLAFPSTLSPGAPISENTVNGALRRMGYSGAEMTGHGFRSSASSMLNESGLWNRDAIEVELAHQDGNQVRKAYHRATYWAQRVDMTQWWGDFIIEGAKGNAKTGQF